MPGMSLNVRYGSDLHKKLATAVMQRIKASKTNMQRSNFEDKWNEAEKRSVAYLPERQFDAIRNDLRRGGLPQYTTIQIPYSYAVLLTSHTYWTTVFLSRSPVLQFSGNHGEGENQVMAVEALQNYQTITGGHLVPYHSWLYDGGKYGHGIVGTYWDEEEHYVSEIVEKPALTFAGMEIGKPQRVRQRRLVRGYMGNKLFNVRPLDFYFDPRVTAATFQNGEYCARWTSIPWNRLVEGAAKGKYRNLDVLKKRKEGKGTYTRDQGSEVVELPDNTSFGSSHVDGGLAGDSVGAFECYIELIPADWKIGTSTMPEKWVITVTDDYMVVIGAQPLGALHNKFPFSVIEIEPEAYSIYNRGIPEITVGLQNTIDWLINSHFYNVRKTLNNEFVVDPSRIELRDLKNPLPGGIIRLKPAAYGTDTKTAMTQVETRDITRAHLNDMEMMLALGERVTGVNDQIMGIANQSSRRSATEVRSSNTFSVNRLKTIAEFMSAMGMSPLSRMMVQNSQQYYDAEMKFRLAGSTAQLAGDKFINVNPDVIAGSYEFVPVDGTLPVDRFAQVNLWRGLLGEMKQIPPLMQRYDIGRIFEYVAQLAGIKNIENFRIQVVPDGMMQAAAQQGNAVPMTPVKAGNPAGGEPGQLEGMGQTG